MCLMGSTVARHYKSMLVTTGCVPSPVLSSLYDPDRSMLSTRCEASVVLIEQAKRLELKEAK